MPKKGMNVKHVKVSSVEPLSNPVRRNHIRNRQNHPGSEQPTRAVQESGHCPLDNHGQCPDEPD